MKLAIMQPYFMPYIGYFQTMAAVDKYVVYDDVQYIKGGWVARNNLLVGGKRHMFTIKLKGASVNKNFNEIEIGDDFKKLRHLLQLNYCKAPFFKEVMALLEGIFSYEDKNLARFLFNSYQCILNYLGIDTELIISSSLEKDNSLKGKDKVLEICRLLGADSYFNAIGGQDLYDKTDFSDNGVELHFVKTDDIRYKQFNDDFEPGLSIIDVLMFNGKYRTRELLLQYNLI